MLGFLYPVIVFWAFIHSFSRFPRRRRYQNGFILPVHTSATPKRYNVVLRPFHLLIDTTAFNAAHDAFTTYLEKRPMFQSILRYLYNVGSVFGILGMIGSICLLSWTIVKLLGVLPHVVHPLRPLAKRDSTSHASPDLPFHLIIPGITAPLSYLPILLLALFVGQTVHELGHAVSAAIESVPLQLVGASIFVILPSAFVSLSATTLKRQNAFGRLRIISGGAFHNLLAWGLIYALGWTGFSSMLLSLAYEDVSQQGRIVVSLDNDSPLRGYIPVGAMITKLNDFSLNLEYPNDDIWTRLMLEHSTILEKTLGWCVEEKWFSGHDKRCCLSQSIRKHDGACFSTSADAPEVGRCIDPVPILTDLTEPARCSTIRPCNSDSICVTPTTKEHLLRVGFEYQGIENVVLWSGPLSEVWQQIEVGYLRPRAAFWPIRLPGIAQNYFMHLKMVMLSLYVVNLLPLPFLDGDQLLDSLSEILFTMRRDGRHDLEAAERGGLSHSSVRNDGRLWRRRRFFKTGVQLITWTVCIFAFLLALLHLYR